MTRLSRRFFPTSSEDFFFLKGSTKPFEICFRRTRPLDGWFQLNNVYRVKCECVNCKSCYFFIFLCDCDFVPRRCRLLDEEQMSQNETAQIQDHFIYFIIVHFSSTLSGPSLVALETPIYSLHAQTVGIDLCASEQQRPQGALARLCFLCPQ